MTKKVHLTAHLPHRLSILLTLVCCVLLVAGCSTKVGSQDNSSASGGAGPQAVVTPIGHKATQSNGTATITVRSGADVLLSGKDTVTGAAALTSFAWSQNSADTPQVELIYRTANTVSFTAPTVGQATALNFSLAVTDAHNNSSTAKVIVNVQPASDPGQFLTTPVTNPSPRTFQVAIVPQQDLTLSADTPLCVSLQKTINYMERGTGTTSTPAQPLQLAPTQVEVKWLQAATPVSVQHIMTSQAKNAADATDSAIASYTNPRATFDVPLFNDEDLFVRFNQPQGSNRPPAVEPAAVAAARIAQQLVPADVDSASLSLSITAVPGTCANPTPHALNDVNVVLAIVGATDKALLAATAAAPAINLAADQLHNTLQGSFAYRFAETADTAKTYYQNIDPIGTATSREDQSLNKWLDANCFNSNAKNYGADAHAVYTNNFDLGFGRDMYFVTCTQSNLSPGRAVGDSASVVINYPSLESAVLKQNVIVAVAMAHNAYSASGPAAQRFTKFFAFAPDDRNGNLYLIRSVNFDRRGQRYIPGACTVCHGGTVKAETVTTGAPATGNTPAITAGDLSAGFMPWDESALLFSDTDPAYTGALVPKAGYTEKEQAASIYALNQHAYATYLTSDPNNTRFAAPMALIQKWYGGLSGAAPAPGTSPSAIQFQHQTFSDSDFPTAQAKDSNGNGIPGTSWDEENKANGDDLYHKVFAHECRACHAQLDSTVDSTGAARFTTYGDFKSLFAAASGTPPNGNKSIETLAMKLAEMPLARLTTDRFWVDYNGGTSAATTLALHGANVLGVSGLVSNGQAIAPGAPLVNTFVGTAQLSNGLVTPIDRMQQVRADASSSFFVGNFGWTLCLIPAPPPGGPALPVSSGPCNPFATLLDATGSTPAFGTSAAGIYKLTLAATGSQGQTGPSPTYEFDVPRTDPLAPTCNVQITVGSPTTLKLDDSRCTGGLRAGDGTNTLSINSTPYPSGDVCIAGSGSAFNGGSGVCPTSQSQFAFSFYLPSGSQPGTVAYQLCDSADANDCASGAIHVTPVTQPTANAATYGVNLPLATFNATPAQNGSRAPLTLSGGGLVTIKVDALAPSNPCTLTGIGSNSDANSLAQFFTLTPCNDHFTPTFSSNLTLSGTPPFLLGGADTVSASLSASAQVPICSYKGTTACLAAASPPSPSFAGTYSVNDTDNGLASSQAPISLYVVETQSFSDAAITQGRIYDYLANGGCAGCHASGNPAWNLNQGTPSTAPSLTLSDLESSACNANAVIDHGTGSTCINTSSPTSSALYINACTGNHNGGNNQLTTNHDQWCANLLQWLNEGAQLN